MSQGHSKGITYETCPICQEPDVPVRHVLDGWDGQPRHSWRCPACGPHYARVAYDCPRCLLSRGQWKLGLDRIVLSCYNGR
jgi:hypothetical protein